jgi:hypothetical protein
MKLRKVWVSALLMVTVSSALVTGLTQVEAGASGAGKPLVGTFKLDPGSCVGYTVSGTYFRMIFPNGSIKSGRFFFNPDSLCSNKGYTLAVPGSAGGLVTGRYQPNPKPAFDSHGGALSNQIVQPQGFTAINFSIATNPTDPQTGKAVPAPKIINTNGKLSGQLEAWSAAWNKLYFNQGSPKPGGSRPGLTTSLKGTYNAKTHAFVLTWTSQVVGGPFDDFTGYWHLSGTFVPAKGSA